MLPLECIVVNDGSTDSTRNVVGKFGSQVRLIDQSNAGAGAARNTGIRESRGDLIAFLDADDYWHPTKLEKQVRAFEDFPDIVLVSTLLGRHNCDDSSVMLFPDKELPEYDPTQVEVETSFLPLFRNPYLGTPSIVVRAANARAIGGFDSSLPIGEDLDFYFKICRGNAYARVDQTLTIVHERCGSLTVTNSGYDFNLEVLDRLERSCPEFAEAFPHEFREQRLAIFHRWALRLLVNGEGKKAREILLRARQYGNIKNARRLWWKSYVASFIVRARAALGPN